MILLDTNIIYYLFGISSPPPQFNKNKLLRDLSTDKDVRISSITFWEIIFHFKKNANIIRRICRFLICNHIKIARNSYLPAPDEILHLFVNAKQRELDKYIASVLPRKIDVEARFASVLYSIILISDIGFEEYNSLLSSSTSLESQQESEITALIAYTFSKMAVDYFTFAYEHGYKINDCENYIRDGFNGWLTWTLPAALSICQEISLKNDSTSLKQRLKEIDNQYYNQKANSIRKKIARYDRPSEYLTKKARQFGRSINDKMLTDFFYRLSLTLDGSKIEYKSVNGYLQNLTKRILLSSGNFKKNDICDALILGSLGKNDLFLTLDNGIRSYMDENKDTVNEYKNSLQYSYT